MNPSEVESSLVETFGSAEVKTFGEDNQLKITTKYKIDEEDLKSTKRFTINYMRLYKASYPMAILMMNLSMEQRIKRLVLCPLLR